MCNAYQHPMDCHCGFGPPYDDVQVEIVKLPSPEDRNPSEIADLDLKFPIRANFYREIGSTGQVEVMASLTNALQHLADTRFGKGHVRVKVKDLRKGSITCGVALVALIAAYRFFKDYDDLSKGVKTFCRDILRTSKKLRKLVHETYHRVETRARAKERKSNEPAPVRTRARRSPPRER